MARNSEVLIFVCFKIDKKKISVSESGHRIALIWFLMNFMYHMVVKLTLFTKKLTNIISFILQQRKLAYFEVHFWLFFYI